MSETTAQKHLRIFDQLKSNRASLEAYWQDLMYYILPRKSYVTRIKSMGDKLPTDIYDSTAILSNAYFAAGMQAYMSSPQTRWFSLGVKDKTLMGNQNVLDYLRDCEDVLYSIINGSNFYQEDVEGYLGLGSIGTDILCVENDAKEYVRFDSLSIENVLIAADTTGRINRAYIEYEFDAEQAIGKFGSNAVGTKVRECYEKSDYNSKFKYVYCVYPREAFDYSKKDAKNMPFASLWIDKERKEVVMEKGFLEFPFMVSRFTKSKGDPYGYSPGMNVLPDIKMLNQMEKTNIMGAQTAVLPPLEIPDEAFMRPFNFNPGGKNIKNTGFPNEHITPIVTGANVPIAIEYVQYKQKTVQMAFYNDLFLAVEQVGDMTATEASIRNNQRMQMLGSAIGNIMREKLDPVIDRVFAIAARAGLLPERPRNLSEYKINYISPLARAQKSLELQNLSQAIAIISQFGTVDPSVFDKVNFDECVDYIADITNITPKIIRSDDEVDDIRQGRAEQQSAAQQMEMLQMGAESMKTAGEADKVIKESQTAGAGAK